MTGCSRLSSPDGHQECVQNEISCQRRLHRPPDDHSTVKIHDGGQVQPAFPGADVRDVRHPRMVRPRNSELSLQTIRCKDRWHADNVARQLVATNRPNSMGSHDSSHSLPHDVFPCFAKIQKYSRTPVDPHRWPRTIHGSAQGAVRLRSHDPREVCGSRHRSHWRATSRIRHMVDTGNRSRCAWMKAYFTRTPLQSTPRLF